MKINTNTSSLEAQRRLSQSAAALDKTLAVLSSGRRINSAADDAAGLGVATELSAQARSFMVAQRNANDGISVVQSADTALASQADLLGQLRELAVQAGNGSLGAQDLAAIDQQRAQLTSELDRVAGSTSYNGTSLLASGGTSLAFQVGANGTSSDAVTVNLADSTAQSLGLSGVRLDTPANAAASLSAIDQAMETLSGARSALGATQAQLLSAVDGAQSSYVNLTAASGRITDADVASAASDLASNQILAQAGVAVLAQANKLQAHALKLLG
jgi:flagellin